MGKLLVIPGADFASVAVGKVTPTTTKVAINTIVSPNGGGTITGAGSYDVGTQVTLTATAASGYTFSKWNDNNTNATRTITVSAAQTYTATFVEIPKVNLNEYMVQGYWSGSGSDNASQTMTINKGTTGTAAKFLMAFDEDGAILSVADSPTITIPAGWSYRFVAFKTKVASTTQYSTGFKGATKAVSETKKFTVDDLFSGLLITKTEYPYFSLNILHGSEEITISSATTAGVKIEKIEE